MNNLNFIEILSEFNIQAIHRENNLELWDSVINQLSYAPIEYTGFSIDYQLTYQNSQFVNCDDFSIIILHNQKAIGVWPISLSKINNFFEINSQGQELLSPIFIDGITESHKRKNLKSIFNFLIYLSKKLSVKKIKLCDPFINKLSISTFHKIAKEMGAYTLVKYYIFLNTSNDTNKITSNFSENLRREIKKSLSLWKPNILKYDSENIDFIFNEFQLLHLKVSGKKTRSDESWEIQKSYLKKDQAFLCFIRNKQGQMVGGAFFMVTKNEACYAVGAYDRNLFEYPVSHGIHQEAIREINRRNINFYKIGFRPYQMDTPNVTQKELSIANFKEKFSSDFFPFYSISLDIEKM